MPTEQIWAGEKTAIIAYLERTLNATPEEVKAADDLFISTRDENPMDSSPNELDILQFEAVENGRIATIKIEGILSKDGPSNLSRFFRIKGTSYLEIIEAAKSLQDMEDIKEVRLKMDTPGGNVDGVDETFIALQELAKKKKVVAENNGLIASAGYWLASAADRIVATSPTDETGSIGVVIVQLDFTEMDKMWGIKEITVRSENAPDKNPDAATKKGFKLIKDRASAIERVFINRIAGGRRLTADYIIENFGKGGLLIAQDPDASKPDALSVKMIDSIQNPIGKIASKGDPSVDNDAVLGEQNETEISDNKQGNSSASDADLQLSKEVRSMTLAEFLKENPQAQSEIDKMIAAATATARDEGAQVEKDKIDKVLPFVKSENYPAAIKNLAFDVLVNKEDPSVLTGAAIAFDALKEKEQAAAATDETGEQPETGSDPVTPPSNDGIVRSEDDVNAVVSRLHNA